MCCGAVVQSAGVGDNEKSCTESQRQQIEELTKQLGILREENSLLEKVKGEYEILKGEGIVLKEKLDEAVRTNGKLEEKLKDAAQGSSKVSHEVAVLKDSLSEASRMIHELKESWLPFWCQRKVQVVQRAVVPLWAVVEPFVRSLGDAVEMVWRNVVLPGVEKTNNVIKDSSIVKDIRGIGGKIGQAWREKVPLPVQQVFKVVIQLLRAVTPLARKIGGHVARGFLTVVDEVERLIILFAKRYPQSFGWAGQGSIPFSLALFVLCTYTRALCLATFVFFHHERPSCCCCSMVLILLVRCCCAGFPVCVFGFPFLAMKRTVGQGVQKTQASKKKARKSRR